MSCIQFFQCDPCSDRGVSAQRVVERLGEIVFRAVAHDIAYYFADRLGGVDGQYKAALKGIGNGYQIFIIAELFFKIRAGEAFKNAIKRYFTVKLDPRERNAAAAMIKFSFGVLHRKPVVRHVATRIVK